MASEKVTIKPKFLPAAISRILENAARNDDDFYDTFQDKHNRNLPHEGLSIATGLVFIGVGALASYLATGQLPYPIYGLESQTMIYYGASLGLGIFAGLTTQIFFLYQEIKHLEYVITPEGVEIRDEFLDKETTSTSFENITDVKMVKPIIQRPFGTGNVVLNTAGSDSKEFKIEFIKKPKVIQEELSDIISETNYRQPK